MRAKTVPVGIDLGTTFSVVAYLDPSGRPCTILNSEGDAITPSVVLFDGGSVVVGKEAVKAAPLEPDRVADFAKRDMGNAAYSPQNRRRSPYTAGGHPVADTRKTEARRRGPLGPITQAVITVPAFFERARAQSARRQIAAQLAGLKALDIINEPTAAAIAFGYQVGFLNAEGEAPREETILVYDLGGGTFDVTLMKIAGTDFTAVGTAGDVYLGGIDWDRRIADSVAEKFKQKHRGIDPRTDAAGLHRLLREAEDAKRTLSAREQVTVSFEHVGQGLRVAITRAEFEDMTADLLDRTRFTVSTVLREAQLTWKDLTRVLVVGGSTRMPMVCRMLEQESGMKVDQSLSPDEAVAARHARRCTRGSCWRGHGRALSMPRVRRVRRVRPPPVRICPPRCASATSVRTTWACCRKRCRRAVLSMR